MGSRGNASPFQTGSGSDYSGAILNTIIQREWVLAAIGADKKIRWVDDDGTPMIGIDTSTAQWGAALDVADGGLDKNALSKRQGISLRKCVAWGDRDPGVAARRVAQDCLQHPGIEIQYDSIGVGSAVKSEYNRLVDDKVISDELSFIPWLAGGKVQNPFARVVEADEESPLNRDFFGNLKAQGWWSLRMRFWRTYQNITNGVLYDPDDMISIDPDLAELIELIDELCQPTIGPNSVLKQIVDKTPDDTPSPNRGDSVMMLYFPIRQLGHMALMSRYSQHAGTRR
jgi:phage terminase large subunit